MKLFYIIPLTVFFALLLLFWRGLQLDAQQLPSVLLNQPLPKFDVPDVTNPKNHLTNTIFLGHVSLLNVWATWCMSCRQEHPFLVDLAREQDVPIYGLDYKDDEKESLQWLNEFGNPYRIVGFDGEGQVGIDLGVYGTPETFVIDKKGIIRYRIIGELTPEIWRDKLQPLLAELQK